VPIGDGSMFIGSNAINLNNGTWRYEYVVFNLNSERSCGGFSVPIPSGAVISNVSIRRLDMHSDPANDARRNTPWTSSVTSNAVSWSAGAPYSAAQPLVNNHIEWGTMSNFSFIANVAPVNTGSATITFYKPATAAGQPNSISGGAWVPDPNFTAACYANCDNSSVAPVLNAGDFTCFLNSFNAAQSLSAAQQLTAYSNCDQSTTPPVLNAGDFTCFLTRFRAGCP
jgi:hypothetical protein